MAKLSTDQLIDGFKDLSLIELSEFVKKFEEVFEVTAAAPVAVAAAGAPAADGLHWTFHSCCLGDGIDILLSAISGGHASSGRYALSCLTRRKWHF